MYVLFPLAALIALGAMAWRRVVTHKKGHVPAMRSTWVWIAFFAVVLAVLVGWGAVGLVEVWGHELVVPVASMAILGAGCATMHREGVWDWYDRQSVPVRRCLRAGLVVLILLFSLLTIEVPFNDLLPFGGPSYFWLETLLAGLLLLALYYLGQRHAAVCCLGVALFFVTGIGQHFVKRFKNAAILPTDLLVLDTAAAVTGEYVFSFNEKTYMGIAAAALAVCALSLVRPARRAAVQGDAAMPRWRTVARNLVGCVASTALLALLVIVPSYGGTFGVQMMYWYSIDYYQMQGFLPSFIYVLQDTPIKKPAGYSAELAEQLTQEHADAWEQQVSQDTDAQAAVAQFDAIKPTVIVVMNESFADLSIYDGMHAGYKGPQFFKSGFDDALSKGTLNVSVFGAGTCNTEFEFLTGNSLSFIGAGKYPYSLYDLCDVDALAGQFKAWGYKTCAIHPNYPSNWKRNRVYPLMGFDTFLDIDAFGGTPDTLVDSVTPNEPHCEVFHSGVSDIETYDRILSMIEEDDAPQFFFDVTMANHGSYDQNNIPADYQTNYLPADYSGYETPARLNEYLSCIEKSDDDLRDFVAKLKELDRPVVLVFFGDHQPKLAMDYNDQWYTDEPEDVHARRAFSSNYVIWANYDVAGREQQGMDNETSVDMLAAQTLDLIGAPVSEYQAAQLDIHELIPSLSASGYMGVNGTWYAADAESPYQEAYHELSLIEYLNFATRV